MDKEIQEETQQRPITLTPQPIRVGPFTIPPLNIRTAVLLERIGSPFVVPQFDPVTGAPIAKPPRITDVTRALYVFVHADDPEIEDLCEDLKAFDAKMLDMARQISFAELGTCGRAIKRAVDAVNGASVAAGLEPSGSPLAPGAPTSSTC